MRRRRSAVKAARSPRKHLVAGITNSISGLNSQLKEKKGRGEEKPGGGEERKGRGFEAGPWFRFGQLVWAGPC